MPITRFLVGKALVPSIHPRLGRRLGDWSMAFNELHEVLEFGDVSAELGPVDRDGVY